MTDQPAKKKKSKLPGQRTMEAMRAAGYDVGVVERWNQYAMIRQDLFNFIDLIAMGRGGIIAVQATSMANRSARVAKILAEPKARHWLSCGGRVQVWAWRKLSKKIGNKTWQESITEITLKDFADMPPTPAVASESPVRPTAGDGGLFADDPLGG